MNRSKRRLVIVYSWAIHLLRVSLAADRLARSFQFPQYGFDPSPAGSFRIHQR